jgi:preprotein translocase subunit SecG
MEIIGQYLLMTLLFVTSVFLILLVLVQRGRGGGLAGAFGGAGGQSAFGTRAGDVFTRVTIVVATIWIILCAASVKLMSTSDEVVSAGSAQPATNQRFGDRGKEGAAAEGEKLPASKPGAEAPAGEKPAAEAPAGEKPAAQQPAGEKQGASAEASEGAVSAAPPQQPAAESAASPAVSLPPGSLTPNGSVAPQEPLPSTTPGQPSSGSGQQAP